MSTSTRLSERAPERPRLDDPLLDRYLEFVESRARHNTLLATASDLRMFFAVVAKPVVEVTTADVLEFIAEQRGPRGDGRVVRLADGESGLSSRTIKRRLSSVSGLYVFLTMCDEAGANPVPRGLATRRPGRRGVTLIRTPRTLPKILEPGRGRRPHGRAAAVAGPGHGRGHGAGRPAPLRGAGTAHRGPAPRTGAAVRGQRQGRPPAPHPHLGAVLPFRRRLHGARAPGRGGHRPALRRAKGPTPGTAPQ